VTVTLVAAIARNGVIGADGGIPWHLPDDQRRFKELTVGHVLVMGRVTYESIGRPLPGRTTVVVTRSAGWGAGDDGVLVASSVAEALAFAATVDDEVFVVGGTRVYDEALPFADRLELTWVDAEPEGDAWFPAVDWAAWREVAREEHDGWSAVSYERAG
jgi:dihydrofolate reductase